MENRHPMHNVIFDHLHDEDLGRKPLFPLQTIQSMAERWGVTKNVVANWSRRHDDFPVELDGLIERTGKTPKVFPLHEVLRYEKMRGLRDE